MKAADLNISELIQFSPGLIGIHGRRLLLHDLASLGQHRCDLSETVGFDLARRIQTREGLFWGQSYAGDLQRLFNWDSKEEMLKALPELLKIMGSGTQEITKIFFDESSGKLEMELSCADTPETDAQFNQMPKTTDPVCWVLAGFLSGYASYCLDKSIYFSETQCKGTGASSCFFIGKDTDSWGENFNQERSFFLPTDIQKKIQMLDQRIREQERALALQRKQMKTSLRSFMLEGVEIKNKAFRNILELADRVAPFDTTILITGETGTGKEVLARHIHVNSPRKDYHFLAVNCSALPEPLLESELFGHKAGSFTGAKSDEVGLFEAASKGTIFLDEIGDVSPAIQAKLLRVLQSKEIRPIGEMHSKQIDVRVISATNHDLPQLVKEGKFREDLYYRLCVVQIALPPLRERTEDILPLARYFLHRLRRKFNINNLRFAPESVDVLLQYSWPGNVRELENALEHAAILCADGIITPDILPGMLTGRESLLSSTGAPQSLDDIIATNIKVALKKTDGNKREAAKLLKISESMLYRHLRSIKE